MCRLWRVKEVFITELYFIPILQINIVKWRWGHIGTFGNIYGSKSASQKFCNLTNFSPHCSLSLDERANLLEISYILQICLFSKNIAIKSSANVPSDSILHSLAVNKIQSLRSYIFINLKLIMNLCVPQLKATGWWHKLCGIFFSLPFILTWFVNCFLTISFIYVLLSNYFACLL